jgi:hypothetical protein
VRVSEGIHCRFEPHKNRSDQHIYLRRRWDLNPRSPYGDSTLAGSVSVPRTALSDIGCNEYDYLHNEEMITTVPWLSRRMPLSSCSESSRNTQYRAYPSLSRAVSPRSHGICHSSLRVRSLSPSLNSSAPLRVGHANPLLVRSGVLPDTDRHAGAVEGSPSRRRSDGRVCFSPALVAIFSLISRWRPRHLSPLRPDQNQGPRSPVLRRQSHGEIAAL